MDNFQSSILSDRLNTILKELKQMNQKLDRIIYKTSKRGFSLVELMIVVAIIGVLTAIAIPNFQRFQARARKTEAKSALTSIYTASKAFHAKWETYATLFEAIGYSPAGDFRYVAGWDNDVANTIGGVGIDISDDMNCDGMTAIGAGPAPGQIYRGVCAGADEHDTETYCDSTTNMNDCTYVGVDGVDAKLDDAMGVATQIMVNEFRAGALTDLSATHLTATNVAANGDAWTIDQNKQLINTHDQIDSDDF